MDATQAQNTYYYQWSDAATTYWASLTKEFSLGRGRRISLTLNAQNLLDRQTITASNNFSAPRMEIGRAHV